MEYFSQKGKKGGGYNERKTNISVIAEAKGWIRGDSLYCSLLCVCIYSSKELKMPEPMINLGLIF